jgi:hypothetical protein
MDVAGRSDTKKPVFVTCLLFALLKISIAQTGAPQTVADFMGINTNVASYDNGYIDELSNCAKWIREYHSWAHYEAANNYYKWDDITTNPHPHTWPNHNKFIDRCTELGLSVLIDALNKPGWMGSSHIPNDTGDGSNASHYREKLEFLGQLVARYGSKTIAATKLKTADKATGLNLIQYYEDENEPNYWWWTPKWPVADYAAYCNAAHDGHGVETNTEFPLLGIKSVDPDAKHVVAGSAGVDSLFFQQILDHSNGRVPFDVLNVHMYCTDQNNAYSPEHDTYGYEKEMAGLFKWKYRVLPDMPIWITEFGWDTYLAPGGSHSYTYATFDAQANYLARSFLILMKMGFEKAFMFMGADTNSASTTQYSSSGVLEDKNNGYEKKPSYFYLSTMQKVLGETRFKQTVAYAEKSGNNEIYCLEFEQTESQKWVYALWTRETASKNDNGATTNYQLDLGMSPSEVYAIVLTNLDEDGDTVALTLDGTKTNLVLTEKPIFVVASDLGTGFGESILAKPEMIVYPNPTKGATNVSVKLPSAGHLQVSVFSADGQLVEELFKGNVPEGETLLRLREGLKSGIYYVRCHSSIGTIVERAVILKK